MKKEPEQQNLGYPYRVKRFETGGISYISVKGERFDQVYTVHEMDEIGA